jgi:hypothetical protein
MANLHLNATFTTMEPKILSRTDFEDGSYIETLEPVQGGEMYYRSCYKGMRRYSSDLWQAQIYCHQMTSPSLPE